MHTAFELKGDMFSVAIEDKPATRQELLDWDIRDRLGVVISEPFGALGAGLLIQLVITAYYETPGRKRRMRPNYPDIFLFHAGGPWGSHGALDFWPDHKEIFVAPNARELLRAINNRGITHLAVPDRPPHPVTHRFKEPESAADRLKRCFVYGPQGTVDRSDVSISTVHSAPMRNFDHTLNPEKLSERRNGEMGDALTPNALRSTPPEELALAAAHYQSRMHEVARDDPQRLSAATRVAQAITEGKLVEQLRRTSVDQVLNMLA